MRMYRFVSPMVYLLMGVLCVVYSACSAWQKKAARDAIDILNATCVIFHVEMDGRLQDVCLAAEELTPYAKELLQMRKQAAHRTASSVASSVPSSSH